MSRLKSFVKDIDIDTAVHSHNCQHNRSHRIYPGEKRLRLKTNRSYEYFRRECAISSINEDIKELEELRKKLIANEMRKSS